MKISLLSPVYNEEDHLSEMIESVLAQTHEDFELIIVDDGSTDRTADIADSYAARDRRVQSIRPATKLGKVAAFNSAFTQSSGDAIVLLGGDDTLPPTSLALRAEALSSAPETRVAAYFALRTMSESSRHDGLIIPKSGKGNFSGGTGILSRELADLVFPIPGQLVAEDVWLAENVRLLAHTIEQRSDVVLNYRIHDGNSNPRNKPFAVMREQMHVRALPYTLILDNPPVALTAQQTRRLEGMKELDQHRYEGKLLKILATPNTSFISRARAASTATPWLFKLRSIFFGLFSGR
ncbi:glycosyltransferase [Microbacterium sp. LWO13-1.2]|uniref:glycosyltransferase family 2 protein n=1 Tax=Microbacterium sp. LWO13-1.2 TaxID=3135262 RepID=UPI003138D6B9